MKQNEFRAELIIYTNNDHPDVITEILGIDPVKIYIKGEQKMSSGKKKVIPGKLNEDNIWVFSIDKKYINVGVPIYISDSLKDLIDILKHKESTFKELFKKYPSSYIGCYAYYYESHEYFKIDATMLKELSLYGIDIVFDSYNFTED